MSGKKEIIHCCVDKDTYQMLVDHCERTGQTKTMAIRRAVRAYCEANGVKTPQAADVPDGARDA